jgi:hypothetical protein
MTPGVPAPTRCYCGRVFSASDIERIRRLIAADESRSRAELSRLVCDELEWFRTDGRRKEMSCRVAMLRMHRDELITLPPPRRRNGNGRHRVPITSASDPQETLSVPAGAVGELMFRPVGTRRASKRWNEFIARYHYLGYQPLSGAQVRYEVFAGNSRLLALLGFGAAAWAVAPRDRFIGWNAEQRVQNLHLVVNNARFLILPWIRCPNLASRILAKTAQRLAQDWPHRYGYEPVLLETFVQRDRFRGSCYRAANWIHVGQTQGRGKLDRHKRRPLPIKDIFLYPLHKHFRSQLLPPP